MKKGKEDKVRKLYTRMQHLYDKDSIQNLHINNLYKFVDTIRACVGGILVVVLSIVVGLWIFATRNLYYTNGKWTFGTVIVGVVGFLFVLGLFGALIYVVANYFLCKSARENI